MNSVGINLHGYYNKHGFLQNLMFDVGEFWT